jgi:hypothetical protein
MPDYRHDYYRLDVRPAELQALLKARLEALDHATSLVTLEGPLPVRWRVGWRGTIKLLWRDLDGSLRARITVEGPGLVKPYVRNLRLCRPEALRLPGGLG